MTKIELVRTQDYYTPVSELDTLDLLCFSGNVGFQIANNGWVPVIGSGKVQESLTLHARGDNQDEVIAYLETTLKRWKNFVDWSTDYTQQQSVWLRVQWENESNIRQARILSFNFQINSSPFGEFWQMSHFTEATITFERMEWEQPAPYPTKITIPAGQSILAGKIALPGSIVAGDINARILQMTVAGNALFTPNTIWAGFRRNRNGADSASFFEPVWNCELGTYSFSGSDTTREGDNAALRGSMLATDFGGLAGEALTRKVSVPITSIAGTPYNQVGKFVVLYRAMNSDDTTVTRARVVYGAGGRYTTLPRVQITGFSSYQLFEMGVISIPSERVPLFSGVLQNAMLTDFFIGIDAERVSGSGDLLSDCLILIPMDEAFIKTNGATAYLSAGTDLFLFQNELGDAVGYTGTSTAVGSSVDVEQRSWGLPPEITQNIGYLIIAGNETAVNSYCGEITITYIPRWTLARGNE